MKKIFIINLTFFCFTIGITAQANDYNFIIGLYNLGHNDTSTFKIAISTGEYGYEYSLQTPNRQETGDLIVSEDAEVVRLTFKNCFYDEPFEGGESVELQAVYENNAILFQNYGNSMNDYTVFSGFPKYLILIKYNR